MSDHSSPDSSSEKLPIKLEGPSNYNTWCRYVKGALKIKLLVDHIADTVTTPIDPKEKADWLKQDQRAQGIIILSVNATMLTVLGDDDLSAKKMWDRLATNCRRQDMWRLVDLLRQLTNTQLLDAANVEQHLAAMSDIRTQFVNYGKAIPEWIAALLLLLSVPTDDPHWEVFLASHTAAATATAAASSDNSKTPAITWDGVAAAIMAEASKQTQQQAERARKQQSDNAAVAAYAAKTQGNKPRPGDKEDGNKQPRYCTHCDRTGHVVEQCWKLHPELRNKQKTNHGNFVTVSDTGTVLACHRSLSATTEPSAGLWYVDSGASYCLTGDRTWFTELRSCAPCTFTAANNGVLTCSQRGTVTLGVRGRSRWASCSTAWPLYTPYSRCRTKWDSCSPHTNTASVCQAAVSTSYIACNIHSPTSLPPGRRQPSVLYLSLYSDGDLSSVLQMWAPCWPSVCNTSVVGVLASAAAALCMAKGCEKVKDGM